MPYEISEDVNFQKFSFSVGGVKVSIAVNDVSQDDLYTNYFFFSASDFRKINAYLFKPVVH